jgi:chaperonin GroEL (HSP60 family)
MNRQYYFSNFSQKEFFHNSVELFLKEVYELLKECYGPYGSHVLIDTKIRPEATKDGKTILSKLTTNSSISSAVHGSIMSVANKQVEEVGDGSTTTILLLCDLYQSFIKIIKEYNISPSVFNAELRNVITTLKAGLKHFSTNIVDDGQNIDFDKLYTAVYTSVDGEKELADSIIDMFMELNTIDPLVLIELSNTDSCRYELVKGMEVDGTIIRPEVFFDGYSRKEYTNPRVIIVNGRLDLKLEHFMDLATDYCIKNDNDIIFLCTGIEENVLENIININNTNPGIFSRMAVFQFKRTANDDEFLDICASIGAKPIDADTFKKASNIMAVTNLIGKNSGSCEKALLSEYWAKFNDPKSDDAMIKERVNIINERIEALKEDPSSFNDRVTDLENRKAFLTKNYAKFYVGGQSPQRKTINYELANDGIPQAISCMKYGVVEGCNTIIPKVIAQYKANYTEIGEHIVSAIASAYDSLFTQLIMNKIEDIDKSIDIFMELRRKGFIPLNLRDDDDHGVMNSADTDRSILENATDMAALLATSNGFLSMKNEFDVVKKDLEKVE